jgi:hypothetical protein
MAQDNSVTAALGIVRGGFIGAPTGLVGRLHSICLLSWSSLSLLGRTNAQDFVQSLTGW